MGDRLKAKHLYGFGSYRLDAVERVLLRDGQPVTLPPKDLETLLVLVERAGHIVEKEELLEKVWPGVFVEEGNLARHIFNLRQVLGDSPDGRKYIETIPKRGYRFVAAVQEDPEATAPYSTVQDSEQAQTTVHFGQKRSLWMWPLALAVLAVTGILIARHFWPPRNPSPQRAMLAVLPFINLSGDAHEDYFADGLTEEMIAQLGQLQPAQLGVIARTSTARYKDTKETVAQIARELGVGYLLEGSVRRGGDRVRVTAQLIQAANDQEIWAQSYERGLRDLLALQNDVARDIAEHVQARITTQDRQRLSTARVLNPAAHEEYLKGRFFWNKRTENGYMDAIDHFLRAIQIDPQYPEPYAGMANTYALLGSLAEASIPRREAMNNARTIARKALELDPTLAEAHTSLAFVLMHYDWDFAAAEKEYLRAIDQNPNYATAHQWYAVNLAATGRMDAALAEIRHAQELDPLSLVINADFGEFLGYARRYEDAVAQLQSTLKMDPNFLLAHLNLVTVYVCQQKYAEAAAHAHKAMELAPNNLWAQGLLGEFDAMNGQQDQARNVMASIQHSPHANDAANSLARIATALGDKDAAFHWLQVARDERSGGLILLKVVPCWDPLRSDPRFSTLLQSVGLESGGNSQQ